MLERREFVRAAAAASLAPWFRPTRNAGPAWPGYERALVIDFLASPGPFNVPGLPSLTDEMVRNAVASGITAVNLTVNGGTEFEGAVRTIAEWERRMMTHPEALVKVRKAAELLEAKRTRRLGLVYGFQDAAPIGTDLDRLEVFHGLGVRVIQLTYNGRNLVGDGCLEPGNAGLSRFGQAVVDRMNDLGIMVDLSHCGQRTTADGIAASKRPPAITHSGCAEVHPHPRSKRDAELRAMAEKGGVLGIYLMPFLTTPRAPTAGDVIAHVEHAIQVCGEDHVGIGSDLSITPIDATPAYWAMHRDFVSARKRAGAAAPGEDEGILFYTEELNTPRRLERIADRLAARGHGEARIEKIIGGNWARMMREVWAA